MASDAITTRGIIVTTAAKAPAPPAPRGLCLQCHYPLRDLPANRCPECGRAFDPDDSLTMYYPGGGVRRVRQWLARTLVGPMGAWVRALTLTACVMIIWGRAWLPGAQVVELAGWVLLAAATGFGLVRRGVRWGLRRRFGLPPIGAPPSERYAGWQVALVGLAAIAPLYSWPLRASLWIQRPLIDRFGWHAYAEAPMVDPPRGPRMVGLFVVQQVTIDIDGVTLYVAGAGRLDYCPEGARLDRYMNWRDVPWWLGWVVAPTAGPWLAIPKQP